MQSVFDRMYVLVVTYGQDERNTSDSTVFPTLKNVGGPPDVQGVWLGTSEWVGIIDQAGSAFTYYYYEDDQDTNETEVVLKFGMNRFVTWECTGVEGQMIAVLDEVDYFDNGTVSSSSTKCALYQVNLEEQTLAVRYQEDGCPSAQPLVSRVMIQGVNGTYVDRRVAGTSSFAPTGLICVSGASNVTGLDTSSGAKFVGKLPKVGSSLGDVAPPAEEGAPFPPSFPDKDDFPNILSGTFYFTWSNGPGVQFWHVGQQIGASSTSVSMLRSGNASRFDAYVSRDYSYESESVGNDLKQYVLSVSTTQVNSNGTIVDQRLSCQSTLQSMTNNSNGLLLAESNSTCPSDADPTQFVTRLQYYYPIEDVTSRNYTMAEASMLNGSNQVPPLGVKEVDSTASFSMIFLDDGMVTFWLNIENIDNFTMAHIHQGNASTNGPVVVELIPSAKYYPTSIVFEDDLPQLSPPASGNLTYQGAFTSENFVGPLANSTMGEFLSALKQSDPEKQFYVNVHTTKYPMGAIRAQLIDEDSLSLGNVGTGQGVVSNSDQTPGEVSSRGLMPLLMPACLVMSVEVFFL
jgi:hypothetical protein